MTTKHTPGPWHVGGDARKSAIVYDERGLAVCNAHTYHGRHDSVATAQANAHLIAQAPQMLATLQHMLSAWKELGGIDDADDEGDGDGISGADLVDFMSQWIEDARTVVAAANGEQQT